MQNIAFGGLEVKKGMFEYEGLMSCLVKVRIMDERQAQAKQQQRYNDVKGIHRGGTLSNTFV